MKGQFLEFIDQYQEMRAKQRMYFATKEKGAMIAAKEMEKELDKKAADIKALIKAQDACAELKRLTEAHPSYQQDAEN